MKCDALLCSPQDIRKNDVAIAELLRVGGCMCIRNYAGQNAIDVRKTEELHMLSSEIPVAVVVFNPSATPTMRIEKIGNSAPSARCEECQKVLVDLARCMSHPCMTPWGARVFDS